MGNRTACAVPSLGTIINVLENLYPARLAEDWDRNGLICGNLEARVERILIALDPVKETVDEALNSDSQLLLTHHPLYLRGTSFVPASDPKGNLIHRLIRGGCALFNAHTNADSAAEGVATALASRLELERVVPLVPSGDSTHPGLGRVGYLRYEMTLREFANIVAKFLPAGPNGVLIGGNLEDTVFRVAVSGGSGDSFLTTAREAGADVYVTADLRHHPALEHLQGGKPYLINASHWATESVWCDLARDSISRELSNLGYEVEIEVSAKCTEPWDLWLPTTESE
ncbi:Nif3-like dinuclear metal center hexameric protein [Actinomycetaceae bacterium TAE3-ERU4]|nr:Nif3-like dinuclear metal center hexameric protein [Actinomycetaceae bacterium TAE3-ERU4]